MTAQSVDFWPYVAKVRQKSPLVHNITNFVVMQTTANALLSLGASPLMAHAPEELHEIVGISSALVVNIGTLSTPWTKIMMTAIDLALGKGIPVVLDPVGAGASRLRTRTALELLHRGKGIMLRGNASEILALAGEKVTTKGVDSTAVPAEAVFAAQELARGRNCTVCVSGAEDLVTDGATNWFIAGGHEIMTRVTGMGCTATALIGAVAGASPEADKGTVMAAGMACMAAAGTLAHQRSKGPGSFTPEFMDALYVLSQEDLEGVQVRIE